MSQNQQTSYPQTLICGIDEVGRGCLAGPILSVAALFKGWKTGSAVNDSKKMSPIKRAAIFQEILKSEELIDFGVGEVTVEEIDKMGIDQANIFAFYRAVQALPYRPNFLVIDGLKGVPGFDKSEMKVMPKADEDFPVVGAASILAKVIRDSLMAELHADFPMYAWKDNKGYGSRAHIAALKQHGPCIHHRPLFIRDIIKEQMELFNAQ